MNDEADPRDVLQQLNERIGKTDDPFAVMQLESLRDQLQETINEVDAAKKHLRVVAQGHKASESEFSQELIDGLQGQVQQAEQQAEQQARQFQELLAAADEGRDLREYLEEKQRQRQQQLQQQASAGPMGPMGPQ